MKHMVITIGCEYGAGGPEIGKMLAKALGIEYYDRDLVDKIINDLDVDKELVEKADKGTNVPYTFETTLGPRYANLTNKVISLQYQAMHKMADQSSCVIIGRSANYLLQDRDDLINIFIYAPDGGPHPRDHGKPIREREEGARDRQLQRREEPQQASVHHRHQSW